MSISVNSLAGIYEKLKRANENILNLESEISLWLQKGENVIVGDEDLKALAQKGEYQAIREPPLKFSVLAGEIIHHLRSTLDHAAWALARPGARRKCPTRIAFPIFRDRLKKNGSPSLKGKIELFASDSVRKIISGAQPYERTDPSDTSLWLIHDLDIKAKHRELPLMLVGFDLGSPRLNALVDAVYRRPI